MSRPVMTIGPSWHVATYNKRTFYTPEYRVVVGGEVLVDELEFGWDIYAYVKFCLVTFGHGNFIVINFQEHDISTEELDW